MALHFLHGETPYGSPDHQVAFFATLEDFLVNTVGWTVSSGAGTLDIVFTSTGESGLLTKLFVRVYMVVVANGLYGEVQDDAGGTHKTTTGNPLSIAPDTQSQYWITADKDCFIMLIPTGSYERVKYLGCLVPMALNPVDETEYMVASGYRLGLTSAVLHHHTGAWDANVINYGRDGHSLQRSVISGEFAPFSVYCGRFDYIVGQYKYMGNGGAFNVRPRDKVTSGYAGASGEWECFFNGTVQFWLQTAGAAPGATPDGAHFTYQTGVEANAGTFIGTALPLFLTAIGWTDLGPVGEWTLDRLFHSTGEDGTRDIYFVYGWQVFGNPYFWFRMYSDQLGTHKSEVGQVMVPPAMWPATYHMAADRDCVCIAWARPLANIEPCDWMGMGSPVYPGLDGEYMSGVYSQNIPNAGVLRSQLGAGAWAGSALVFGGQSISAGSSPNLYGAGTTYVLWPYLLSGPGQGWGATRAPACWMKYAMYIDGAPLAVNDTITFGAETYLVLRSGLGTFWAMRIA